MPKTERHILTADIGGTNSRMEQACSAERPVCAAGNPRWANPSIKKRQEETLT